MGGRFAWFFSDELPNDFDHRFPQNFEDRFPEGFIDRFPQDFRRGGVPFLWRYLPTTQFPWARGIMGLLVSVGVVALVVIAINGLIRTRRLASHEVKASSRDDADSALETDKA